MFGIVPCVDVYTYTQEHITTVSHIFLGGGGGGDTHLGYGILGGKKSGIWDMRAKKSGIWDMGKSTGIWDIGVEIINF